MQKVSFRTRRFIYVEGNEFQILEGRAQQWKTILCDTLGKKKERRSIVCLKKKSISPYAKLKSAASSTIGSLGAEDDP